MATESRDASEVWLETGDTTRKRIILVEQGSAPNDESGPSRTGQARPSFTMGGTWWKLTGSRSRSGIRGEEVETQSLGNALGQASMERVDLIKTDVEVVQQLVVRGADKIVASHKPAIIFEVNQEAAARLGLSPRRAWDQLKSLGYKLFSFQSNGGHKANSLPLLGNIVAIYGLPEP